MDIKKLERQQVEKELVQNEEAYKLYEQLKEVIKAMDKSVPLEPSPKLKMEFDQFLQKEIASSKKTKMVFFQPVLYRAAAAVALLIVGVGMGFWLSKHRDQQQAITKLEEELKETKMMMLAMMNNNQSASQRIQGVNVALTIAAPDDEVVKALASRMNDDPNTNVRLAALEALSKFHQEPNVKKILINALNTQKDPMVQIALIQLMVKMKETGIVNDLKRIVDDEESMKAVKDEAYSGLLKLS
jgi:hypothetical protein